MKKSLFAVAAMLATVPAMPADVGTLGGLGEPGFYGQINIHRGARPQLVFPDPVVIREVDGGTAGDPVYMRVPAEHAKNWRKHCQKYNACDQRVFFVDDQWYTNVYVPEYRKSSGEKP